MASLGEKIKFITETNKSTSTFVPEANEPIAVVNSSGVRIGLCLGDNVTQLQDLELIGASPEIRSIAIPFTAAIPFILYSATSAVTINQNYTLSLGADAIANSYHTITTTGNGVNTLTIPTAWKNINGGAFDPIKVQKIRLSYDGTYVEYTIVDLATIADIIAPTVTLASTVSGTTSLTVIPYTITLSEASVNFISSDLTVGNGTIQNFTGSGTDYTVEVVPTASGNVTLQVLAGAFTDAAGNPNTASNQISINYQTAYVYPTWANTQSMVIDAQGEAVEVTDSNFYPQNNPFSLELIYKMPSVLRATIPLRITDDTATGLIALATTVEGKFYLQLLSDASNKFVFSQIGGFPVASTWYHMIITCDGNTTTPAITMNFNNTSIAVNGVETGNYVGLPALTGNCKIQLPWYSSASYGEGSFNVFRKFNRVLTSAEKTALYNARINSGLTDLPNLIDVCHTELRFEGNGLASKGTNGVVQGSPTYAADIPS